MTREVLRLSSLYMINFRNYRNVRLEFSPDPHKTITIFHGTMSSGKTTIMNAIHWCLYGKEPHFINEGDGKPVINQKALNEAELARSVETSVEMTFSNNKGPQYGVKRTLVAYRKTDLRTKIPNSLVNGLIDAGFEIQKVEQVFSYIDRESGGWQYITHEDAFNAQVERLLPEKLSTFVFFNGELLDKFFSTVQTDNIRNGMERVSGLGIIDNAIEHLNERANNYRKKASIDQGDLSFQLERKDQYGLKRDEIVSKLKVASENELNLQTEETRLTGLLRNNSLEVVREEEKRLSLAKTRQSDLRSLLYQNSQSRKEFVSDLFAKVLLKGALKEFLSVLYDAEMKGLTPPRIDSNFIREKLEQNQCICGTEIPKGSPERDNIEKMLAKFIDSEVATEAQEGRFFISEMMNSISDREGIIQKLNEYREIRNKYNREYSSNDDIIDGIIKNLKSFDAEKIRKLGEELEQTTLKLNKNTAEKLNWEDNIRNIDSKIKEIDSIIDKENEKSAKAKPWKDKQDLSEEARRVLEQIREETLEEIRRKVEHRTNEIFKRLISRRWQLDKVEISRDYRIKVLDKEGVDNLKTLSAGQTLYLSLAFISALRDVTAINYPMIIDSPFGKVSGQERVWAAEDLPTFLPETQITFLVTDTEYSSDVINISNGETIPSIRTILLKNNRIWNEYNLTLVKEDDVSAKTEINLVQ